MISITCTNCNARLEMDDGFAGGVCRCMYCGTIQTVPSHLKRSTTKAGNPKPAKALFRQDRRTDGSGSGLDHLSDTVGGSGGLGAGSGGWSGSGLIGSGLGGSGMRSGAMRAATVAPRVKPRHKRLILGAAVACAVVLLAVVLWLGLSEQSEATGETHAVASLPAFCGVELDHRVVIYVLDRGSATSALFADLKEACYRSVESLGPDKKFQIIFWNNGTDEAFPRTGPGFATPDNVHAARRALRDVFAHGQTDVNTALAKAFAAGPGAVVIATGKGPELDATFVQTVDRVRQTNPVKVYTFALGSDGPGVALREVAERTGGEFRMVPAQMLREFASE